MSSKAVKFEGFPVCFEVSTSYSKEGETKIILGNRAGDISLQVPQGTFTLVELRAIKRSFDKRLPLKLTVEIPISDVDEARELLAKGNDKAAMVKALDILERLDK